MHPPSSPFRVAIIGISGYGGTLLRALEALHSRGVLRIEAATVINEAHVLEKCAKLRSLGCRIYEDYREMFAAEAGRIDFCCIPTGIPWHCEMTVAALDAHCHVLVEKPAAGSIQEVDEMIGARILAGRQVAVGFQHLYQDSYSILKHRVAGGEIGRLREIRVKVCWPRSSAYYSRNDWAGRLQSRNRWVLDSPANNACAHFIMAALHLAGPDPITAANPESIEAELYRSQEIESFDTISARVATDAGVPIFFAATHSCSGVLNPVIQLLGDEGSISWEFESSLTIRLNGHVRSNLPLSTGPDARIDMLNRIFAQIRGLKPEICPLEEARKHTLLINTLHEAVPIYDVAPAEREFCEAPSGVQSVITGITGVIRDAFDSGRLFSEMEVPWAQAASSAPVRPMREFGGQVSARPVAARRIPSEIAAVGD